MADNRERRKRISLSLKLNITTVIMILLVTLGLLQVSYTAHRHRLDATYYAWAVAGARKAVEQEIPALVRHFRETVDTEEFREVYARAQAEENEEVLLDWMRRQPGFLAYTLDESVLPVNSDPQMEEWDSLLFDYEAMRDSLGIVQDDAAIAYVALEYARDGEVWFLADQRSGPFLIGTLDDEVPDKAREGGSESIPPTLYESRYAEAGWLCTAYEPIVDPETGEAVAMVAVDVDMNRIVHERHSYLRNIVLMMIGIAPLCMLLNILAVHLIAVRPLKKLTEATCGFAGGREELTRDDVIDLDIRSRDEINDLYQEIRKMQGRIVDYTGDLARFTAAQERLSTEMRLAEGIQSSMLPEGTDAFPDRMDFELSASMTPAKEVGGDFYDFYLIDPEHLALTIADVSGKGVPGALFMMSSMIRLKDRTMAGGSAAEILAAVNSEICQRNRAEMFVTVWLGILDLRTGAMDCANAGHEYPMLRTGGSYRLLKDRHGLPLGAVENAKYRGYELSLLPGDAVFVYTDGATEATAEGDGMFGTDRLLEALNEDASRNPKETLSAVRRSIDAFVDGAEQFDDLTMLCLHYRGQLNIP